MSLAPSCGNKAFVDEQLLRLIKTASTYTVHGLPPIASTIVELDALLAQGARIDGPRGLGELLKKTIDVNNRPLLRMLLDRGANPNLAIEVNGARGPIQSTLLHAAILRGAGSERVVVTLLAFGADVHAKNGHGATPLDLVAMPRDSIMAHILANPLHAAVKICQDPVLCARFLDQGHSEEQPSVRGETPVAAAKRLDIMEISAMFDAAKAMRAVDASLASRSSHPMAKTS